MGLLQCLLACLLVSPVPLTPHPRFQPHIFSYGPNAMVVGLTILFCAINGTFLFLEWFVKENILEYVSLFYGVFIGWHAVRDIYDDLITRTAEGSDAVACHQLIPCCFPRCVGVQFWLVAFSFQVLGLYIALAVLSGNDD